MAKLWICADLHFSHRNIIAYENRPFASVDEMDKALIRNWNSVVGKEDKVFVLGDVSFASKPKTVELVGQLNGYKVLIMGNHDRQRNVRFWQNAGFDVVIPYPVIYGGRYLLSHEPPLCDHPELFSIYGHVHGDERHPDYTEKSACVSIERIGYRPARFEDVITGKAYDKETNQTEE